MERNWKRWAEISSDMDFCRTPLPGLKSAKCRGNCVLFCWGGYANIQFTRRCMLRDDLFFEI